MKRELPATRCARRHGGLVLPVARHPPPADRRPSPPVYSVLSRRSARGGRAEGRVGVVRLSGRSCSSQEKPDKALMINRVTPTGKNWRQMIGGVAGPRETWRILLRRFAVLNACMV